MFAVLILASCSRSTPTICSSVNPYRFIVGPLSGGGLYSNLEEVAGAQVSPVLGGQDTLPIGSLLR
jgi:hypothetical protein